MKPLRETKDSLVLRTDFSDDAAWEAVCAAIQEPSEDGFTACVECVSDPGYAGVTAERLAALAGTGGSHAFVFLVDRETLSRPERPVLVVDLLEEPGRAFRVIPDAMWSIENNLSLGNMDYDEFADAVDPDGVFRCFDESD